MFLWLLLLTILTGLGYIYLKVTYAQTYWKRKGVKSRSPVFLFGDLLGNTLGTKSFAESTKEVYNEFPENRYTGMYSFILPVLMLKEADIIKQMTVKDFDHFTDHRPFFPENIDSIWSKNLFALRGRKWRDMRATLSPAFTSSKMRQLFILVNEIGVSFTNYFQENFNADEEIEMKDIFSRFSTDVIATSAFGIQCNSLADRDNEFYKMGHSLTTFDKIGKIVKFICYIIIPNISKFIGIQLFSPKISKFFSSIVKETIKQREEKSVKRPDMINILMEAKKGRLNDEETEISDTSFAAIEESEITKTHSRKAIVTDDDIAAQAIVFFFAGFDTVSTCMAFMAYELAVHPDIQEKLQKEIDEVIMKCDGNITYDLLLKMKYMDMVVSETLRMWPSTPIMDRLCTKPYTIEPVNESEKPVYLEVGDKVWLPLYALHRDPKYHPNPDKFDPERFSDENKSKIIPYSYIPFGSGPRACLGSRFALLETKILFFHLLSKFNLIVTDKTQVPVQLYKRGFGTFAEKGIWLKFQQR